MDEKYFNIFDLEKYINFENAMDFNAWVPNRSYNLILNMVVEINVSLFQQMSN